MSDNNSVDDDDAVGVTQLVVSEILSTEVLVSVGIIRRPLEGTLLIS